MVGQKVGKTRHNQRYDRNEREIQKALLKLLRPHRGQLTARRVAKTAGLTRQTFYNHHPNINQAITEGEKDVMKAFTAELDIQSQNLTAMIPDANERLFYAVLIFMARHKDIFYSICADINNQGLLYQIAEAVFLRLQIEWMPKGAPAPALGSERADMFVRMVVEVICKWGVKTHCDVGRSRGYINRLLRITADAEQNRIA